jgi:hypothetical protein
MKKPATAKLHALRAKADAALIATAPELLTALREIAERGPVDGYTSAAALRLRLVGIQTIARQAIAKATQKEPKP